MQILSVLKIILALAKFRMVFFFSCRAESTSNTKCIEVVRLRSARNTFFLWRNRNRKRNGDNRSIIIYNYGSNFDFRYLLGLQKSTNEKNIFFYILVLLLAKYSEKTSTRNLDKKKLNSKPILFEVYKRLKLFKGKSPMRISYQNQNFR